MSTDEDSIVSPFARDISEIPSNISLVDYVLGNLRANMPRLYGKDWMVDIKSETKVKFEDVEDFSRRIASGLVRLGFKQGDTLYYVTYEMALLFVVHLAVWSLGGITRGGIQAEPSELYHKQITEMEARFILFDEETSPVINKTLELLTWPVTRLCFGKVEGAIPVRQLLMDDGSAIPRSVPIKSQEDVVFVLSSSGSTGDPKGILHTHFSAIAGVHRTPVTYFMRGQSVMSTMMNFSYASIYMCIESLCVGGTVYNLSKLNSNEYFECLLKYKPQTVAMYPYLASWFARSRQLKQNDLSFLKMICIGAAPLDSNTVALIFDAVPKVSVEQIYGLTETTRISLTKLRRDPRGPLVSYDVENSKILSCGKLLPYVKAKIIDPTTGCTLKREQLGEIVVKTPGLMLGYIKSKKEPNKDVVDEHGWFHTGDLGFFDMGDNLYIRERINFIFKYKTAPVNPSEIESVLLEHEAVHGAGVVGIPNPETDNLARAFIVLRMGCAVTALELENYVKGRLSYYKWLHGGVRFIDALPQNTNNKLDRKELKKLALNSN